MYYIKYVLLFHSWKWKYKKKFYSVLFIMLHKGRNKDFLLSALMV